MSDCKKIEDETKCKSSEGCLWNKSKKCQQAPTKKNKPSSNVPKTHTIRSYFSPTANANTLFSTFEHIPIEKLDTPPIKQKTVSPYSPEPCDETEKRRIEASIKYNADEKRQWNEKCNETKYMSVKEQSGIITLLDLVKYIVNNKIDKCSDLFEKFPETNERINGLSRPYIFEALWKIIFLLQLDNLTDGYKREYITALEEGKGKPIDAYDYLHSDEKVSHINSGSASGIADFYFTVLEKTTNASNQPKPKQSEASACESREFKPNPSDVYIFTSKFYRKEKGIGNYDIADIALDALEKYDKNKFKIVSLVRNGSDFRNRLSLSSKEVLKSYVDSNLIFDESDLYSVYYPKLWTWLEHHFTKKASNIKSETIWRKLLNNPERILNLLDNLRFHQKYVVEYTNQRIEENLEETKNNPGKFIWGAVARSGKSYMIGGLVAKRQPRYVLLILGAVNETKGQFIDDLFKKYSELKGEYQIIDFQKTADRKEQLDANKKYVFVISQENLRAKLKKDYCEKNPTNTAICKPTKKTADETEINNNKKEEYSNDVIHTLEKILEEPNKVVFFDEIHQGSGEDAFQTETIQFFYNERFPKPLFIMVSATYAKPLGKYGKEIGDTEIELIEWNYEMIMKMKQFKLEHVTIQPIIEGENASIEEDEPDYLINRSSPHFYKKMEILHQITTEMMEQGKTCEDISHDYENYPELVYLLPMLKPAYNTQNNETGISNTYTIRDGEEEHNIRTDLKKIFTLNKQNKSAPEFKYKNAVNKWLDYIYRDVYNELLEKKYNYVANGEGKTHSQLWFLPTSMKEAGETKPEQTGIVGPMLKNMGKAIINHPRFTNFDVCVVHSANETEKKSIVSEYDKENDNDNPRKLWFECIRGDVKPCITRVEKDAKIRNKSLIILTAQRLRLGISLPCVDVAIHMDNIQSYDILYQSMFRVLTERAGKTHGYFVDMVTSRAMKFMYKYTQIQQNITNKTVITDEKIKKYVKQNLLLFDVGSIRKAIGFSSVDTPMNSYTDIATAFKLDKDATETERLDLLLDKSGEEGEERNVAENPEISQPEKAAEITQNIEMRKRDVEKLLNSLLQNKDVKEELIEKVKQIFEKQEITSNKTLEKKGTQSTIFEQKVELGDNIIPEKTDKPPKDPTPENKEDMKKIIKHVVEQLKNIFTLFILFNDETSELNDILADPEKVNKNVDRIMKCEDPDIMYYCYLLSGRNQQHMVGDVVRNKEEIEGRITHIEQQEREPTQKHSTNDIDNSTPISGGAKHIIYTIKWASGDETKINEDKINKIITNLSIPYYFQFDNMSKEYIQTYIGETTQKHIDLIQMLISNQSNDELNKLYVNIKEEMSSLKERTKTEMEAFQDASLENCPEMFIENKKVLDTIRKYLTPKESEKKIFGEVFTPLELVCEMLSTLPVSVWKDKHKTWLDPANGIGNFPIVVYYKLMEGLKHEITDPGERSKWIIGKMLYMGELNPVNVALTKRLFKMIDPDATPNVIKADFIEQNDKLLQVMREKTGNPEKKFDIIMGNPPYNNDNSPGDSKPYLSFTFISICILEKNGFLLFITPPAIYEYLLLIKEHKLSTNKTCIYNKLLKILTINSDNNYLKRFFKNVGSEFTYFALQNKPYEGKTQFLFEKNATLETHHMDISKENTNIKEIYHILSDDKWSSIRSKLFHESEKTYEFKRALFNGKTTRRIRKEQIRDGIVKTKPTTEYKYKIINKYSTNKDIFEPDLYYYNETDDDYDKTRLIVNGGFSYLYPYIIKKNTYTLSDHILYVVCEGNACDNLLFLLESPLGKYIAEKYVGYDKEKLLLLIEKVKPLHSVKFSTNEDMYKFFKLTKDEIEKIEETTSKPTVENSENPNNSATKKKSRKTPRKSHKPKAGNKKTRKNKGSFIGFW